jgi:hypothetical protein
MKWFRKIPPPTVGIQSRKAEKNTSETNRRRWKDQVGGEFTVTDLKDTVIQRSE